MGLLVESHKIKRLMSSGEGVITEGFFKNLINTLFTGKSDPDRDNSIEEVELLLKDNKVGTDEVYNLLDSIISHSNSDQIGFNTLGRTLSNVLLKKGDKTDNVIRYFSKIIKSLDERPEYKDKVSPEDFLDPEDDEKSAIPSKQFGVELRALQVELLKMQEWLKDTGSSVIVVFEGRDSAGKGSTIKKFVEYLDPKYYKVVAKDIPTPEEREDWFGRYGSDIESGKIIFFDRSWYNRGIVEPVMGYGTYEEYEEFMANVNGFEKALTTSGNYLIKFWMSITKDTQSKRFDSRKSSPLKYWKYSLNDTKAQDKWEEYTNYKKRVFKVTSTDYAPWAIVDANDKRISGLNAIRYVLNQVPYENKDENVLSVSYPETITTIR